MNGLGKGRRLILCALAVAILPGCGLFSGKPPLPRHASIDPGAAPSGETDYAALVANAEIVYFPSERAASGGRAEPSALLLDALRQSGTRFGIGWDLIEAGQQPALEELRGKTGSGREEAIARIDLEGTGRALEHCRAILRDARLAEVVHLALRCPDSVVAKVAARERLTSEEEELMPQGYAPPSGGFDVYAERFFSRNAGDRASAGSYRTHLVSQQFAAERIVRHLRAAGAGTKLLVFLRSSDLEAGRGVPRYVAQKLQVRQLVLDSGGSAPMRGKLLTGRDRIGGAF